MRLLFLLCFPLGLFAQATHNALHFDGTDDYISTSAGNITSGAARTVEAWIRTDANCIPNTGGIQQVVLDMGAFGTGTRYTLCLLWSNSVRIEVGGSGLSGTRSINDSLWHHIAAVYDPTSSTAKHKIYIDGALEASGNLTTAVNSSSGGLQIGRRVDGANPFEGDIDEVRVWTSALSSAAIAAHSNEEICGSPSNLKAYYTFNQGTADGSNLLNTTLNDQAGTNSGTLNNFSLSGTSSNWTIGQNMNPSIYDSTTMLVCNGIWSPDSTEYWDSTAIYRHTFVAANGCDSIVSYDLTVKQVDTSISVTNSTPPTISSNAQGATYQWVNCNDSSIVVGATQSFFVPSSNGDYAVVVAANGCSLWSQCVSVQGIGIKEFTRALLYPNPTSGILHVPSNWRGQDVEVSNLAGQTILTTEASDKLDLRQAPVGVYVVRCGEQYARIIKQ